MNQRTKPIRLTGHAKQQCLEAGTNEEEVREAIVKGSPEIAKGGRLLFRHNRPYGHSWQEKTYAVKQVAPVVVEEENEFVVITVYTFYF